MVNMNEPFADLTVRRTKIETAHDTSVPLNFDTDGTIQTAPLVTF
jgi:hypothetical protein